VGRELQVDLLFGRMSLATFLACWVTLDFLRLTDIQHQGRARKVVHLWRPWNGRRPRTRRSFTPEFKATSSSVAEQVTARIGQ